MGRVFPFSSPKTPKLRFARQRTNASTPSSSPMVVRPIVKVASVSSVHLSRRHQTFIEPDDNTSSSARMRSSGDSNNHSNSIINNNTTSGHNKQLDTPTTTTSHDCALSLARLSFGVSISFANSNSMLLSPQAPDYSPHPPASPLPPVDPDPSNDLCNTPKPPPSPTSPPAPLTPDLLDEEVDFAMPLPSPTPPPNTPSPPREPQISLCGHQSQEERQRSQDNTPYICQQHHLLVHPGKHHTPPSLPTDKNASCTKTPNRVVGGPNITVLADQHSKLMLKEMLNDPSMQHLLSSKDDIVLS